jgi:hypothetical protein
MSDKTRGCIGKQEECMKQNYYAITSGWSHEAGVAVADSKAGARCEMCQCACVGGWKVGTHMDKHTRKLLERKKPEYAGDDAIIKTTHPQFLPMSIRGFGDFSLGTRTADHQKRTDVRKSKHDTYMEQVEDDPQHYSPVVPYKEPGGWMVGMKIESRWWVGDSSNVDYLHSFEGTVMEVVEYSDDRENYSDFRLCKHKVAKVHWDDEFDMIDSHVPLDPRKYLKENAHCGWNVLTVDYVEYTKQLASITKELGLNVAISIDEPNTGAAPVAMEGTRRLGS